MSKRLHGSYYLDGRTSQTFITDGRDKLVDVGFRLLYDSRAQGDCGSYWKYEPKAAAEMLGGAATQGARVRSLGFRLVHDGEGT